MLRDDREDKEEKRMSNGEVEKEVQEVLDRKVMKDDIRAIKANQDGIFDLCKKFPELCEEVKQLKEAQVGSVEALVEKVEKIQKQQELFCDPKSGQCFVTKQQLEEFLEKQNAKIPQILDGAQDLSSFFQKAGEEEQGGRLHKVISERMPTKLKVGLIKYWCGDDEECRIALEKDPDIKISDTTQRKTGLLGTAT